MRDSRRRRTHDSILAAARALFETRGYAATTVDEIAVEAGTTRATLYLHFASKSDVLDALVHGLDERFHETEDPSIAEVVRRGDPAAVRAWLDRKLRQWEDVRSDLVVLEQSEADADASASVRRWHEGIIERMRAALDDAGRFAPETREIRCAIAFGSLETLSRRFTRSTRWTSADRAVAAELLAAQWVRLLIGP